MKCKRESGIAIGNVVMGACSRRVFNQAIWMEHKIKKAVSMLRALNSQQDIEEQMCGQITRNVSENVVPVGDFNLLIINCHWCSGGGILKCIQEKHLSQIAG